MKEPQQISFWHKSPTGYTENTSHHLIHSIYLCYIVNISKKSMFSNSLKLNAFHFCQIVYVTFWRYIHCCLVHFIENKQILNTAYTQDTAAQEEQIQQLPSFT